MPAIDGRRVVNTKTISESLFEDYLRSQGLAFKFEKTYPGKSKLVDYTVAVEGGDFLFEVKQFEQKNYPLPQSGPTYIDPHRAIRAKIEQAKEKFREYDGFPCCLVMFNSNDAFVMDTEPHAVLGAMYGEIGVQFPLAAGVVTIAPSLEPTFVGEKGRMIHREKPCNTRISAVISLYRYHVGSLRYGQWMKQMLADLKAGKIKEEDIVEPELSIEEVQLAVSVWKNIYADTPFPETLFRGLYDEHWGLVGDYVKRTYIGPGRIED
jgi:hypothetical protein